ncbi:MAG: response regulator [Clostridia bacterium]|nr:response regulator [Clostridia bacterium]
MKVILVDDEITLLEELQLQLKGYGGITVAGAYTDPLEALKNVETTKPDCALLDIEMGVMNGIELATKLVELCPGIEVLFITAYNNYAAQAFDVNAVDYILKPVRPERLARAMEKIKSRMKRAVVQPEAQLKIMSFGTFEVFLGDTSIKWPRTKARELLAYLLQNEGCWIGKFRICDDLWRDFSPEKAVANLQTAVWALRKALKDIGCSGLNIEYSQDKYILNMKEAIWDKKQFDNFFRDFCSGSRTAGQACLKLYRGEYLQDEDWPWSDYDRERYALRVREIKKQLKQ